jgi:NAD-dependent deacetylase
VLTGAGVSAASGVPTFRGPGGLWKDFRPEELATPEAFARDPRLVWEWYDWRRQLVSACRPNAAHEVLAAWSRRFPTFTLVTQNVDGLHEAAGTRNLLRFHGSIWEVLCARGCKDGARREDRTSPFPVLPPPCACGGPLRPGVVWFGEAIDPEVLVASGAAMDCDVCIAVGTSAVVFPAAALLPEARARGAFTAEINPEATPATRSVDCAIAGLAEEALPAVDRRLGAIPA